MVRHGSDDFSSSACWWHCLGCGVLFWLFMARRILARIRGTEERYHLLFDHAADAIVMVDAAD